MKSQYSNDISSTKNLHYDSIVVDTHNDTMMKVINSITWLPKTNIGNETGFQIDIPKLKKGGLNVVFFSAFTSGFWKNSFERSNSVILALLNALYWTEANNQDSIKIASRHNQVLDIVKTGKIAAIPTIEGAYSLNEANGIELLNQYYDIGVRVIALQWNYSNALGEGTSKKYKNGTTSETGLTNLGKEIVKEMNRLGMIVDVSHMSEATFWDVIETSNSPIMASHSGVYSIKNHRRNLTDRQIQALATKGGVVQIVFFPGFLGDGHISISSIVDHIDYVVNLVGVDYVGLGSDFDGAKMPKDLPDASYTYRITEELVCRGYSESDIKKILGENSLNLLNRIEKHSAEPVTKLSAKAISIKPAFEFGGIIQDTSPLLTAVLELSEEVKLDITSVRIILDGIAYKGEYDAKSKSISYKVNESLKEKFHVVTFEVVDVFDNTYRTTSIFHVNRNWLTKARSIMNK